MKWFGSDGWGPVCIGNEKTDVPKTPCGYCNEPFVPHDFGIVIPNVEYKPVYSIVTDIGYHQHCLCEMLGFDPC
jgi:hypothetical protein